MFFRKKKRIINFLTKNDLCLLRIVVYKERERQKDKYNSCLNLKKKDIILNYINDLNYLFDCLNNELYN